MNTPTKYDDIIDSRQIIARIDELQSEREALTDAVEEAESTLSKLDPSRTEDLDDIEDAKSELQAAQTELQEWDDDNAEELKELTDLASEGEDYSSNWKYGETLIRDSHFRDYAQELAEELDLVKPEVNWPYTCIDWDRAARELQMDYSAIEFGNIVFWIRSC